MLEFGLLAEVGCWVLGTLGLFLHSRSYLHPTVLLGLLCLRLFFLLWVAGGSWQRALPLNPSSNVVLSVFAANQGLLKLISQPAPGGRCQHGGGPRVAQGGCCCRWQWSRQEHVGTTNCTLWAPVTAALYLEYYSVGCCVVFFFTSSPSS